MRLFWLLTFFFIPQLALAQFGQADVNSCNIPQLFELSQNDVSFAYLAMIFGKIGNLLCTGFQLPLMTNIMSIFNMGILTVVGFIIMYSLIITVMQTAQQGSQMAKKVSPFVMLRVVTGTSLLVPMSSGYSAIQALTMYVVIQGIGLADQVWTGALEEFEKQGGAYTVSANTSVDNNLLSSQDAILGTILLQSNGVQLNGESAGGKLRIDGIYAALMCSKAWFLADQSVAQSNETALPNSGDYGAFYDGDCKSNFSGVCFGKKNDQDPTEKYFCGEYTAPQFRDYTTNTTSEDGQDTGQTCTSTLTGDSYQSGSDCTRVYNALTSAVNAISSFAENNLRSASVAPGDDGALNYFKCNNGTPNGTGTETFSCGQTDELSNAATVYLNDLGSLPFLDPPPADADNPFSQTITNAKNAGWLLAGMYYTQLAGTSAEVTATPSQLNITRITNLMFVNSSTGTQNPFGGKDLANVKFKNVTVPGNILTIYNTFRDPTTNNSGANTCSNNPMFCFTSMLNTYYTGSDTTFARGLINQGKPQEIAVTDDGNCPMNVDSSVANALLNLYKFWLKYKWNDSVYDAWNLDGVSQWAKGLSSSDQAKYSTAIPQQNLYVMMNRSTSELVGLNYFSPSAQGVSSKFDNAKSSTNAGKWDDACSGGIADACYKSACSQGLINTPFGLFGMMNSSMIGQTFDPMAAMRYMGMNMLTYGLDYYQNTISQTITAVSNIALLYAGVQIAVAASISAIVAAGMAIAAPSPGVATVIVGIGDLLNTTYQSISQIYYQIDNTNLNLWTGISTSVAGLYIMLGFYLGIYLANIPAITYVFAGIGYFIIVIEAMVAAPIVAMGLAHPEGHDLLGKAEQSIMLYFSVFLRPVGMVFGLIFAIQLLIPAFDFLNYVFIALIGDFFAFLVTAGGSYAAGNIIPLLATAGVVFLYAYMAVTVTTNVFGQIYSLPDKLMRWIGGAMEQSGVGQMVSEVKSQTGAAAEKMAAGGADAAKGAGKQLSTGQVGTFKGSGRQDTKSGGRG